MGKKFRAAQAAKAAIPFKQGASKEERASAYHEAGHIVADLAFGIAVRYALFETIIKGGVIYFHGYTDCESATWVEESPTPERYLAFAITQMAGPAAEMLWGKTDEKIVAEASGINQGQAAIALGKALGAKDGDNVAGAMMACFKFCERFLQDQKAEVCRIAEALLQKKRIEADEIGTETPEKVAKMTGYLSGWLAQLHVGPIE